MTFEHVDRYIVLMSVGGGTLIAGGLNLLVRRGPRTRAAVACGSAGLAAGVVAAWTEGPGLSALTWFAVTLLLTPGVLHGTGWSAAVASRFRRTFTRPAACSAALVAVGSAVLAAGVAAFVREEDERAAREAADLLTSVSYSPPRQSVPAALVTDRGTRIDLSAPAAPRAGAVLREQEAVALRKAGLHESVIRRGPAGEQSNCFGWVFAHHRYWLAETAVAPILTENGYRPVDDPRPGDLVLYRSATGLPAHAGVVRYVTDGMPVLVEGKWGWMGVYLHPVDRSPFGTDYAFYRSPRATHHLPLSGPESDHGAALTGAE